MYRFLLEPRWIAITILVPVAATGCFLLSNWQWGRFADRADANSLAGENLGREPVPLDSILSPSSERSDSISPEDRWRSVSVQGHYDASGQRLVWRRSLNGVIGFWVATPFLTTSGGRLVVNRGWVPAVTGQVEEPSAPQPPSGEIALMGRLQKFELPRTEITGLPGNQIAALEPSYFQAPSQYPSYPAYVDLISSQPTDSEQLTLLPAPDTADTGRHLSYAIQWILFAIVFLIGWVLLVRREAQYRTATPEIAARSDKHPIDAGYEQVGQNYRLGRRSAQPAAASIRSTDAS